MAARLGDGGSVGARDTRYARNGEVRIAYQVAGQGALDLAVVPGFLSNLDLQAEDPGFAHLMRRLTSFARVILIDKRGMGLSDRIEPHDLPGVAERMEDIRCVLDAAGSGRAAVIGIADGAALSILLAASYPERVRALILYAGYAHFSSAVAVAPTAFSPRSSPAGAKASPSRASLRDAARTRISATGGRGSNGSRQRRPAPRLFCAPMPRSTSASPCRASRRRPSSFTARTTRM